jgi:hypothetical protein
VNSRQSFVTLFGLLAAAAAVVFFAISIDRGVYAPGAWELHTNGELGRIRAHAPARLQGDLTSFRILRKLYSIVAFAIVGFFAAPVFEGRHRLAACALLVGSFSTAIEIAQRITGAHESLLSNLFDIGCGALGGLLGGLAFAFVARARRSPG